MLTGGLLVSQYLPARSKKPSHIKGRITAGGKGLADVVVSDGYTVLRTDKNGVYEMEPHADAVAIFVSTPSGYHFLQQKNITRHYHLLGKEVSDFSFELAKLDRSDDEHSFLIWADPQVKNAKDVKKMMEESVPDVQQLLSTMPQGTLVHGITVGDIVWDELKLFADYDKAVEKMGVPFFQCLGNHDMDFRKGGDETSDDTFHQTYGPTYYSFNRGEVHYVVMDNVRYLGRERDYDGFIQQHQLDWLQKDLSFVPKDKLIVLCVHIPVHSGTKNREDLYFLLKGREVHIMSGHTHYHVNAISNNVYEHNHGTVCGAWWTGPICEDGTPSGYGVYTVKGKKLSWQYKSVGQPIDYQMKIHMHDLENERKQLLVNIWNWDKKWKTQYFVDGVSKGKLEQSEGFDPQALETMLGPDLPKPRGFAEPKKTKHLFKAVVPAGAKEVRVVATDRFGRKYTQTVQPSA